MLPFSRDLFLDVFLSYHQGTWPAVVVCALLLLATVLRRSAAGVIASAWRVGREDKFGVGIALSVDVR